MKKRRQNVEIPQGWELEKIEDGKIIFKESSPSLPKTWREFCETHEIKNEECLITSHSTIDAGFGSLSRSPENDRNLLPNIKTAEAFLAMMQLIQLRDCYRQGWKPNWGCDDNIKYVIISYCGEISNFEQDHGERVLSFQTKELRDEFGRNFRDLIETAKELL